MKQLVLPVFLAAVVLLTWATASNTLGSLEANGKSVDDPPEWVLLVSVVVGLLVAAFLVMYLRDVDLFD